MANETTHAADAAHGAASGPGMPQLDIGIFPNLIFWLVISIVLLYLILTRIALPRLNAILAERNDAISNDLEQAQIYKQRAADAEKSYEKALAEARAEAKRIGDENKAEIDKELSALLAKADAEIAVKASESETRIAEIRENASKAVEEVAKDTAGEIAAKFLPADASLDAEAVARAVADRMKG